MSKLFHKMNLKRWSSFRKRFTIREILYELLERMDSSYRGYQFYSSIYENFLPTAEELAQERAVKFALRPCISLVVPLYETQEEHLLAMIASVCAQTYGNWELCLADGSADQRIEVLIKQHFKAEQRIKYRKLKENLGIAGNTNAGLEMAQGEYIGLLDHDDLLAASALYEVVREINQTGADLIYTNEDKVSDERNEHLEPHFKLNFNRERLLGNNYICHFLVFNKQLLTKVSGFCSQYDGAQDFDFVLRLSEHAQVIRHIPKMLYHWRIHPGSTADNSDSKVYAYEAGKRAIEAYLARQGWQGEVRMMKNRGFYQITYAVPVGLRIGIYIWSKDTQDIGRFKYLDQIIQELTACGCEVLTDFKKEDRLDYVLVIHKAIKSCLPHSVTALLGSCARAGITVTGVKTISRRRVVQCGYIFRKGHFTPLYAGLRAIYKGYFKRAVLAAEVDALSNQMAIVAAKQWWNCSVKVSELSSWLAWCYELKKEGNKLVVLPQVKVIVANERV